MADRMEWVEIVEPRTQEHMYANLATGECAWNPPPGVRIKKSSDTEHQWWELFDSKTSRFYYYNASSQKTVWHRPRDGDIIPLAKLQTLKNNTEAVDDVTETVQPVAQREIATQTSTPKKEAPSSSSKSAGRGAVGSLSSTRPSTAIGRCSTVTQTSSQTSPQQPRKHRHTHHARRTQSTLDKGISDSRAAYLREAEVADVPQTRSSTRRSVNHTMAAPSTTRSDLVSPVGGPQRSLESPQAKQLAAQFHATRENADQLAMTSNPAPKTNHIGSSSSASYFQRQDSYPMMRDSSRGSYVHDAGGGRGGTNMQFQDVSQITAVQVTPRPKPRAFPRTNPSYVGSQRRDGSSASATYRPADAFAASAFNQGYRMRHGGPDGNSASSARYYPAGIGSQTLQTSHSYVNSDVARRSGILDDDLDSDSSQSSSDSSIGASGVRRQYTLDSRPVHRMSRIPERQSTIIDPMDASAHIRPAVSRRAKHSSDNSMSSESSPIIGFDAHQPSRPAPKQLTKNDPDVPPRSQTIPNGVVRPSTRRNSEPDYVNVPTKSDMRRSVREVPTSHGTAPSVDQSRCTPVSESFAPNAIEVNGVVLELTNDDVDGRNGDGTLRIRDHSSPSDYMNCEELRMNGNHDVVDGAGDRGALSSALRMPQQGVSSAFGTETNHPSLRRRKWVEKPGNSLAPGVSHGGATTAQQIRQSTLEKSLSLQAELAQQRPVSMVVPYGGAVLDPSNSIVNQVADTLMQQMDIERFLSENLNEHRRGILGKTVPVGSMLIWTKDLIQKPMIKSESKLVKKEAPEVFKLIQTYMGDRKVGRDAASSVALEILGKGWSVPELRDEIFIQICRQTTRNPREESLLHGWELLAICLSFFPPSAKFQSYLEGHIFRCLDTRDPTQTGQLHHYASTCSKRLERVMEKRDLRRPSMDEVEHSKWSLVQPSMFGGTLEEIMDLQQDRFPGNRLPWIQTVLSEQLLKLCGNQLTEGIFRVPGDTDEVSALKSQCDRWIIPDDGADPHIVASLLKLWYRELYEPLIPREFYARCVEAYESPEPAVDIVRQLPETNRLVLTYLIRFLQKFAAPENAAVTKMDANNLAMVMAPNCLRCDSSDPQVMFDNARKEMGFMRTLIQHLDTTDVEGVV